MPASDVLLLKRIYLFCSCHGMYVHGGQRMSRGNRGENLSPLWMFGIQLRLGKFAASSLTDHVIHGHHASLIFPFSGNNYVGFYQLQL